MKTTVTNRFAVRLLLSAALCCAGAAFAAAGSLQAIPNFHSVDPGIYRGAAPTVDGLRQLKEMGIKTVVDLRISPKRVQEESREVRAMGMNFINLPMGSDPPTRKQVTTLLATLKQAPQAPVFVHCQYGADRTGCMIGVYRVTQDGWSYPRAYTEMRKYGFKKHLTSMAACVETYAGHH